MLFEIGKCFTFKNEEDKRSAVDPTYQVIKEFDLNTIINICMTNGDINGDKIRYSYTLSKTLIEYLETNGYIRLLTEYCIWFSDRRSSDIFDVEVTDMGCNSLYDMIVDPNNYNDTSDHETITTHDATNKLIVTKGSVIYVTGSKNTPAFYIEVLKDFRSSEIAYEIAADIILNDPPIRKDEAALLKKIHAIFLDWMEENGYFAIIRSGKVGKYQFILNLWDEDRPEKIIFTPIK